MPMLQKPVPATAPVIGIFAPCDPRIDDAARERAQNIAVMTGKALAPIKLPLGQKPGIWVASRVVQGEADADAIAAEFKAAGVAAILIVPDTWFYPGRSAMAVTAHFPPSTPLACIAGNNAPKPGVVGVDALVGAYAQSGILCPAIIGNMPETGSNPEFDDKTKAEIVDLAWAMSAACWLRGKRLFCADTDSMQMETAANHIHAARRSFGLESTRESMKLFADYLRLDAGYDKAEFRQLKSWTMEKQWKGRIYGDTPGLHKRKDRVYTDTANHAPKRLDRAQEASLDQSLKLYLMIRDHMRGINAIGGGWTSQLAWGSDKRGIPMACADIAESLFNSTFDHRGKKAALPFATENDFQALLTMTLYSALTGGEPVLFADFRKVYEPWEIQRAGDNLGVALDPATAYMQRGCIDMDNSGSGSLDWAKESFLFEVEKHYFPGGGFSVGYVSPANLKCQSGRIAYSDLTGGFAMTMAEATSVTLPAPLTEAFCHASSYTWPHTFLTFDHIPASIVKYACPANHIHMVRNLPRRRWQWFSDFTGVLNVPWEGAPAFTEGVDRIAPMMYRIAGGEQAVKLRQGR
jgi:L-fucose isomerase